MNIELGEYVHRTKGYTIRVLNVIGHPNGIEGMVSYSVKDDIGRTRYRSLKLASLYRVYKKKEEQ